MEFAAWLLPPVAQRVALSCLVAGPGITVDDPHLTDATAQMATDLLRHNGL